MKTKLRCNNCPLGYEVFDCLYIKNDWDCPHFKEETVLPPVNLIDKDARIKELEEAIRNWLDVRMKGFTDQQYGKGDLRKVLEK